MVYIGARASIAKETTSTYCHTIGLGRYIVSEADVQRMGDNGARGGAAAPLVRSHPQCSPQDVLSSRFLCMRVISGYDGMRFLYARIRELLSENSHDHGVSKDIHVAINT